MLWYRFRAEKSWGSLVTLALLCGVIALGLLAPGKRPMFADSADAWTRGNAFAYVWAGIAAAIALSGVWRDIHEKSILYTLSMPVTRHRILAVSAVVAIARLAVYALIPSLMVPALAPLAGKTYPVSSALLHGIWLAAAGMLFYALGLLIALSVRDPGTGGILVLAPPVLLTVLSASARLPRRYDIYHIMVGGNYFSGGGLPWAGLAVSLAACALLFWGTLRVIERRDF